MRRSPVHEKHLSLDAKFAEFGGWEMPLEYGGGGVLKEHTAVRTSVGVFDVSHLGKARVSGTGAAAYVDATLSNALSKIEPGKAQYTLCCDDATGGVVDDLILYYKAPDELFLVPNAANGAEVVRRLAAEAPDGVSVVDLHTEYAVFAVQGPKSDDVVGGIGLPIGHPYMSYADATWRGVELTVCRTGYTGEHGYELVAPAGVAGELWDALLAAGEPYEIRPCGLGARDTLRTEMGYPLHGQDLSMDITPVQGRVRFAVGWKKPAFWGRDVLLAEREAGPKRRIIGLVAAGRGIPRPGMPVLDADGAAVGQVTSGTFSPTRRTGVGLALLDASVAEGDEVVVDVRGRQERFTVTRPPFVDVTPKA